ncbi:MAG: PQQ-binding-like beta-propeller repeat protein [Acidobacteriota bacterium]|nr:PQQ-binding-like beta-propeller repeat protein [Acidobacteriota bacterium]
MRKLLLFCSLLSVPLVTAQDVSAGRKAFETHCAQCHGADGNGGEMGPPIAARVAARDNKQLTDLIHNGLPTRGMPPSHIEDPELANLLRFVRTLQRRFGRTPVRMKVATTSGTMLDGLVLGEGFDDLQLQTDDKRIHLLRRAGSRFREVTSDVQWPTYNGDPGGNRFTTLTQIDKTNVSRLASRWVFSIPNAGRLQVTPVVVDGVMYVTAPNECYALDAGSGRQLWRYQVARSGTSKEAGANRGVAVAGDRVFMETYSAHLIALNRFSGELLWDTEIANPRQNYFATSAPLPAGNLVISGVGGGEHGANGFVAAYDQSTGKEVWRFWTVPKRGEPGSETWKGSELDHGGAPTWFTGSYDPELDMVYWPTGNPSEEYNGDNRPGDNLYSDCILALDRKTGKLKWHYQFTPHDLWDWDATETSVMVDADWQGRRRNLMLHADRNGFFYVFDRADGKLLLAKQFIKDMTWASGIGADGRPVKLPNQEPSAAGTKVCPSQDGATNWFSPSYSPVTGLYYFQTFEKCSIYQKSESGQWEAGKTYLGGSQRTAPDPKPERVLKAVNIRTGAIAWELPQPGPAQSWGGTLATATGLVIFGAEGGELMAADASTGKPLWSFATNQTWKASPMTYSFDGTQYIAVASGSNILAFAVQE